MNQGKELRTLAAPVSIHYRSSDDVQPDDAAAPSGQLHQHDGYELYYLFNGYRSMHAGTKSYMMHAGDLMLLPPGLAHQGAGVENMPQNHVVLHVRADYLQTLLSQCQLPELASLLNQERLLRLPTSQQYMLDSMFYELQQELTQRLFKNEQAVKARLLLLLIYLLRNTDCDITQFGHSGHKRKNDIDQVITFIDEHYADPVTLAGMAKIFMTNPCALSRSFKRQMGIPPISYLNQVRIQAAKDLIETSDLSLTQICSRVGYESLTYFGRVFKDFIGVTPSQYRKQLRSRSSKVRAHG